jgi:UDP-2-acetamido-2-deoxy-ribo-hexuluronate aminotransferase
MNFIDLQAQQRIIRDEIEARIQNVLSHGKYIMGPEIQELEERLAEFVGVKHAISCSSGTDALLMAIMALKVGPGDAVFTTPFTFISTAEVIALLGATPVFVDIDPRTFNLDPSNLRKAVEGVIADGHLKAKAIIPVDLFGLPADYDPIMYLAEEYQMFVIEDAAQSFGAIYKGKTAGNLAHIGATSFFPAKPLGCYGDGGALFTNDDELAEVIRSIRIHGKGNHKYDNLRIGLNGRLDTLQAAILLAKLDIYVKEFAARQRIAMTYTHGLDGLVRVPRIPQHCISAWAQYSILTDRRSDLQKYLSDNDIPTAIYYPNPLHLQPALSYLSNTVGDFPIAEMTSQKILSLPMHPYLENEQIDETVSLIQEFLIRRQQSTSNQFTENKRATQSASNLTLDT